MTEQQTKGSSSFVPYNQYEVSVPFENAGTCLQEVAKEIYGPQQLWTGFR